MCATPQMCRKAALQPDGDRGGDLHMAGGDGTLITEQLYPSLLRPPEGLPKLGMGLIVGAKLLCPGELDHQQEGSPVPLPHRAG